MSAPRLQGENPLLAAGEDEALRKCELLCLFLSELLDHPEEEGGRVRVLHRHEDPSDLSIEAMVEILMVVAGTIAQLRRHRERSAAAQASGPEAA